MRTFTVSFFGHRQIEAPFQVESQLEKLISQLLQQNEFVEFLVGREGEFDQLVSSTIRRCKRNIRDDNSALIWVMPYPTAEFRDNESSFLDYYDEIEVCEQAAAAHYKSAFQIRNREMVDRSDMVIVVHRTFIRRRLSDLSVCAKVWKEIHQYSCGIRGVPLKLREEQ